MRAEAMRRMLGPDEPHPPARYAAAMTFVWFVVWLVADLVGGAAPLTFDPVNAWAGGLILALALDLNRQPSTWRRK